jgi:hypothetical protein
MIGGVIRSGNKFTKLLRCKRFTTMMKKNSNERVFVQIEENWISPKRTMKRYVVRDDGVASMSIEEVPKKEYKESSPLKYFLPQCQDVFGNRVTGLIDRGLVHLLPKDFSKKSVPREYFSFTARHFGAAVFGSASMVLSTQSLLVAIGLGAGALPVAATLNWVLKDGLGQLGGVLFASLVNNRFDTDPKRWRFVAACSQDAAMFLEALTPLFPAMFLPMAAIANMGKNVSWLTVIIRFLSFSFKISYTSTLLSKQASATKASIHLSFALKGNLADITAKAGSQNVVASTLGTSFGVGVAAFVIGDGGTFVLLPCLAALSSVHLMCLWSALRTVNLNTLNAQRTFSLSLFLHLCPILPTYFRYRYRDRSTKFCSW